MKYREKMVNINKRVTIVGRRVVPLWLIVVLLAATGLGAASGSIFAGKVVGEIQVSTTGSAGGLLVGSPLTATLKHSPNDANWENNIPFLFGNPTGSWPLANQITDFSGLAFPDGNYESTAAGVIPPDRSKQMYKFYVGPNVSEITRIVVTWKGYAQTNGFLTVWDNSVNNWAINQAVSSTDSTYTITITSSTAVTIAEAFNSGYVYVQAYAAANQALYADYVSVTVTYTAIDLDNWYGFRGPEITQRKFPVPSRHIGVHSDDQSAFEAASELAIGDWWLFALPIKNASTSDITARLTLVVPPDLNVYVVGPDEMNDPNARIRNVVKIGENVWKFIVDADAEKLDDNDYLYVIVNAHDDGIPGNFRITGLLEQVAF